MGKNIHQPCTVLPKKSCKTQVLAYQSLLQQAAISSSLQLYLVMICGRNDDDDIPGNVLFDNIFINPAYIGCSTVSTTLASCWRTAGQAPAKAIDSSLQSNTSMNTSPACDAWRVPVAV
jgi:hypothetical protein